MEKQTQRILVVDDDQRFSRLYGNVADELGYEIEICADVAKASVAMARHAIDVILLNACLPGNDGILILTQAQHQPIPPEILILGDVQEEALAEPTMRGLLLKPFTASTLRETLVTVINERANCAWPGTLLQEDLALLHEQLVRFVMVRLAADRISLMLWNAGNDRIAVAAVAGVPFVTPGDTAAPLQDSVSGWVIRHAEPLIVDPDGELPFDLQGVWRSGVLGSGLCVPLLSHGRVLGVLTAARRRSRLVFERADLETLLLIAAQAAGALEAGQLQRQAQRRTHFMTKLNAFSSSLVATLDADQVVRMMADTLLAALPHARGYVMLRDEHSPWFDRLIALGEHSSDVLRLDGLRDEPGLAGLVLSDGMPRLRQSSGPVHDLAAWEHAMIDMAAPSLLCVALKTENSMYGVIELADRREQLGDDELQFAVAVAGLAAPAMERARRFAAISHSEERYRALFQYASDAIFLIDTSAMVVADANPAAELMSGYSQADLRLIAPSRLFAQSNSGRSSSPVSDLLSGAVSEYEGSIRTRSGHSVPVLIGAAALTRAGTRHLLLMARNIAEQQRQSQRLAQAEKLAGMARLTAAIAHEINNPLQALHNTLHLLLHRSFTEEKREWLLNMGQMEVDRLTSLVRRMLDLHRPASDDMRPVSVHGLLEGALTGTAKQFQQHHIEIERQWTNELPWVLGIGGHLKQVFQDLAMNAIEAMPNGGRLVIRTRLEEDNGAQGRVLIEFADTGPGLADGEAHLIFEPFYSTKHAGTGLGLAISYSIVERHGGALSVSSSSDGTTFRVALPAALVPVAAPQPAT